VITISGGTGTELNPLFYSVGTIYFWVLSYAFIILGYVVIWFLALSSKAGLAMFVLLTCMTAYDFAHDFIILEFHKSFALELWEYLLKQIVR
jgi:hypothetical protein